MITPAYALTATERVLPRLALDFTTGALDPRVTVTRALNTATRVNSSGYIETVNADLPRFDYDPATLLPKGLLIEESRANLAIYSEDFRNTADAGATRPNVYLNMTLSQNVTASPYGVANASDKLVETSATGNHGCYRSGVITVAGTYAYTVRVKPGERFKVQLQFGSTGNTARFTLQGAGSVDYTLSATASIRQSADGWYYCTMVASPGSSTTVSIVMMDDAGNISYAGDPTKGLYVDCIQVETGAFATSYIPTTTTSLTRNADAVSMTGTNFSSWYNATEGSFVVSGSTLSVAAARPIMQVSTGALSNGGPYIYYDPAGSRFSFRYYTSAGAASGVISYTAAGTPAINTNYRWAFGYKTDAFVMSVNGNTIAQDTSGEVSGTPDTLRIGNDTSGTYINGYLTSVRYWPQRFINAETQAFSK